MKSIQARDGWYANKKGFSLVDNPYCKNLQTCSHEKWQVGWEYRENSLNSVSYSEQVVLFEKYPDYSFRVKRGLSLDQQADKDKQDFKDFFEREAISIARSEVKVYR